LNRFDRLPPDRPGRPASPELAARRAGLTAAVAAGFGRLDPPPQTIDLAGIRALRFAPAGDPRASILHVHGGAFRIGCPEQVAGFAAALAARCGVEVICPAYRLAPEHPFPAGLRDVRAALSALQRSGDRRIILSGDSAGGGLASGLAALARRDDRPPIGLALLSPWLDLTVSSADYVANAATDPLFSAVSASEASDLYLQGLPRDDPLASPLFGDVAGFPPSFVSVGSGEVLLGDARGFVDRLHAGGVPAELSIVPGMEHVAVTRDRALTGAAETFDRLADFVDRLATTCDRASNTTS
jgi:acetyl esterase/lipase